MKYRKGESGNPAGKPPRTLNRATVEVRELARRLVLDEAYQKRLKRRLIAGTLPANVESLLWFYSFGRPIEKMEIASTTELPALVVRIEDATPSAD